MLHPLSTLLGFTLVFINLPNIPAETHSDFIVTLCYHYDTPTEAHSVVFMHLLYQSIGIHNEAH